MAAAQVFITGASGFVGKALRRASPAHGMVIPLSRAEAVPTLKVRPDAPATLIHLAWPDLRASASGAAGDAPSDPKAWPAFLDWSAELAEACVASGVRFVGIGSGVEAYVDQGLAEPYLTYARRKRLLREALGGDRIAWVRLHFLFGEGEHPARLVPSAIRAAMSGEAYSCGARDRRRAWLDIDDLARALLGFAAAPQPGVFDIAGRTPIAFDDLFDLIELAVGRSLKRVEPAAPPADGRLKVIAPMNLAPNLPQDAGLPANLLDRLKRYTIRIAALGDVGDEQRA